MDGHMDRVITLIDMDCFYCQVELRLDPTLAGKPVAVVQYNQWKQGGIIAVNYEARDRGVNRFMRGEDAKKACPEICLPSVPSVRGKADLTRYRDAGAEVASVFSSFSDCVERASVDEAFIDLTGLVERRINKGNVELSIENLPSTFVVGFSDLKDNDMDERAKGTCAWLEKLKDNADVRNPDYRLAVGALIVEEIRKEVLKKTGFHCSGGIAHNKILAKLVAGLHKPKCQTLVLHDNVPELYESIAIKKVRNLGGKFGKTVAETLNITLMSELYEFSKDELIEKFNSKNGAWLYNIARGIDHDQVTSRLIPESIGCSKNFPGPAAIMTKEKVLHWLKDMATEVVIRLEKDLVENCRKAKLLTISYRQAGCSGTRSCPLNSYKVETIANDAYKVLMKMNQVSADSPAWSPPIEYLGISTSKFADMTSSLKNFLKTTAKKNNGLTEGSVLDEESKEKTNIDTKGTIEEVDKPTKSSIEFYFTAKEKQEDDNKNFDPDMRPIKAELEKDLVEDRRPQSGDSDGEASTANNPYTMENFYRIAIEKAPHRTENIGQMESAAGSCEGSVQPLSFFEKILAQKLTEKSTISTEMLPTEVLADRSSSSTQSVKFPAQESKVDEEFMQTCPDCQQKIHLSDYLEHIDYHTALRIDRDLNGKMQVKKAPPRPPKVQISPAKKKRKVSGNPNQREITNFFVQQPK